MEKDEIVLTLDGKKKYEDELSNLVNVVRPDVVRELTEAKEQGDLSENADYDAARNRQAEIEGRINYLQNLLSHAKIINVTSSNVVALGTKIKILFKDTNEEESYTICGPAEADPEHGKISNACLLSQSLLGHKEHDIVSVKAKKPYEVEILEIC